MRIRRTLVQYGTVIAEKEPKTPRSRRTVALDAAAVAALRRHRIAQAEERLIAGPAYTNDDRVFADEIGRPLTPGNVSRGFSRQVKAAGLPQLTLHGLRHTFATLGLEAGVDTLYLSENPGALLGLNHSRHLSAHPRGTAGGGCAAGRGCDLQAPRGAVARRRAQTRRKRAPDRVGSGAGALVFPQVRWCRRGDLNPYAPQRALGPQPSASTKFRHSDVVREDSTNPLPAPFTGSTSMRARRCRARTRSRR